MSKFYLLFIFLFLIPLISANNDYSTWSGQYYVNNQFQTNSDHEFIFNVYDDETLGNNCYTNTTILTTGNWGEWGTTQQGVNTACGNYTKEYFLEITIDGDIQIPRRRLLFPNYVLKNSSATFWNITANNICYSNGTGCIQNLTNIALTNQTNNFTATQNINGSLNVKNATGTINLLEVNNTSNNVTIISDNLRQFTVRDSAGHIYFRTGSNANTFGYAGATTVNAGNAFLTLAGYTGIGFNTISIERMRITADGFQLKNATGIAKVSINSSTGDANFSGNITAQNICYSNQTNCNITNTSYYLNTNPSNYWNDTFATFNKTYADALYYGIGNSYGYYNSTTLPVSLNIWANDTSTYINESYPQSIRINRIGLNNGTPDANYLLTNSNGTIGSDYISQFWDSTGGVYENTYFEGAGIKRYTPNNEIIHAGTSMQFNTDWSNIYLDAGQSGSYYWSQDEIRIGRVGKPKLNFVDFNSSGTYNTDLQTTDYETLTTNGDLIALEDVQAKGFSVQIPDANELLYYKLDENSGTNIQDYSNTGVNGTMTIWDGNAYNKGGKIGEGIMFSVWLGGSYIDSNQDTPFQFGSNDFTLNIWAKDSVAGNDYFIGKGGTTGDYYGIGIDASSNAFMDIGGTRATLPTTLNKWHMITGVREGNNIYVYVDGVQSSSADVTGLTASPTSNNLIIGGRHPTEVALTTLSTLDEARVINRSLSSTEVLIVPELFPNTALYVFTKILFE